MNRRTSLSMAFLVSLALLAGLAVIGLASYLLPRADWVRAGKPSDYPPAPSPYQVPNSAYFIVNPRGEILVLSNRPPNAALDRCRLSWVPAQGYFSEPCRGTKFALDGSYLDGPASAGMSSHPYEIRGEEIWVDAGRLSPGQPAPTASKATPPPAPTPIRSGS